MRTAPIATGVLAALAMGVACEVASGRVLQTFGDPPQSRRYHENIALGPSGRVFVLTTGGRFPDPTVRVKVYTRAGVALRSWRVTAPTTDIFDMAVDAAENVYVAARGEREVLKYSATGKLLARLKLPGTAPHTLNLHVAIDPAGQLIVGEGDGRIWIFDAAGKLAGARRASAPDDRDTGVYGLAVTSSGATYVSNLKGIVLLDPAGGPSRYVARSGQRPQDANGAALVAGLFGTLYVVDRQRVSRVQRFGPDGAYLGSVGAPGTGWVDAAVASDGTILALTGGPGGAVQRLAAITTVDVQRPSVVIDAVESRPRGPSSRVAMRLRYRLSERSALRLAFARREDRGRYAGRYRHTETFTLPPAERGSHSFDWLAPSPSAARLRRGAYKVFVVAWDEAGLESATARGTFSLRRL